MIGIIHFKKDIIGYCCPILFLCYFLFEYLQKNVVINIEIKYMYEFDGQAMICNCPRIEAIHNTYMYVMNSNPKPLDQLV